MTMRLTPDELLAAAQGLSDAELDEFISQVLVLRVQRKSSGLSAEESALLLKINQALPEDKLARLHELSGKRQSMQQLTEEERAELIELTGEVERLDGERVQALSELAELRQVSPEQVMNELGIKELPAT